MRSFKKIVYYFTAQIISFALKKHVNNSIVYLIVDLVENIFPHVKSEDKASKTLL